MHRFVSRIHGRVSSHRPEISLDELEFPLRAGRSGLQFHLLDRFLTESRIPSDDVDGCTSLGEPEPDRSADSLFPTMSNSIGNSLDLALRGSPACHRSRRRFSRSDRVLRSLLALQTTFSSETKMQYEIHFSRFASPPT